MTIHCPKCIDPEVLERFGGKVKGLWDIYGNKARCTNCGYERLYHRRKARTDTITPSQNRKAQFIKEWFENNRLYGDKELHSFEITHQKETGFIYVSIKTTNHPHTMEGGHFCIGRRGGIKVLTSYDSYDPVRQKESRKHYAKMLGGKVGW